MIFARRVFLIAGIYGLLTLGPQYFLETKTGVDYPPAVTHPEFYYGFVGVGLTWQILFLLISRDPLRFRPVMIPAVLEKLSFGIAAIVLFTAGRLPGVVLGFACVDLILGALFVISFVKTPVRYPG